MPEAPPPKVGARYVERAAMPGHQPVFEVLAVLPDGQVVLGYFNGSLRRWAALDVSPGVLERWYTPYAPPRPEVGEEYVRGPGHPAVRVVATDHFAGDDEPSVIYEHPRFPARPRTARLLSEFYAIYPKKVAKDAPDDA